MLGNNSKGWNGCLSKVGKDAAIHAFLKLAGYKSGFKKQNKKINIPRKYDTDNLNLFKDNLIIVKTYHNTVKNTNSKEKKKQKKETNKNKEETLQFHNVFHPQTDVEESRQINSPSCTKYTPKYDLVFPKLLTGPEWKIISGRKYKKIEIDEKDFLITHESKIIEGEYKCLVNMNKATQRGELFGSNDIRVRSDKKFDAPFKRRKTKNMNNIKINKSTNKSRKINKSKSKNKRDEKTNNVNKEDKKEKLDINSLNENNTLNKIESNENINNIEEKEIIKNAQKSRNENNKIDIKKPISLSFNSKSTIKIKNPKKKQSKIYILKNKKTLCKTIPKDEKNEIENEKDIVNSPKKINNTINFEKIISREKIYKLNAKERYLDVARVINYSLVTERPKMLTFYNTPKHSNIIKKFKGIEPNPNFDAKKANNIRVIHSLDRVPDFNLILPRPGKKKNPLPSFMQKIFNREANYLITDKSLKLNGYSTGKLGKVESSFFPKQSFNNMVNIKIMGSKTFEEDCFIDDINHKKDIIKNTIKFKHKSLGKLIKEGALTKFDNVTYKTFHKTKNFLTKELDKYLVGLKEK